MVKNSYIVDNQCGSTLFDEEEYWFLNKSLKHQENSDIIIVNMLISLFIYLKIVRWKPWKGEMNYKRNFVAWV